MGTRKNINLNFNDFPFSFEDIAMSLCGGLKEAEGDIAPEKFLQFLVTYDDFCQNPNILSNPNLVIRIGHK